MKRWNHVLLLAVCGLLAAGSGFFVYAQDQLVRANDADLPSDMRAYSSGGPIWTDGLCDTLRNLGTMPAYPSGVFGHASATLGDTLYIAGGSSGGAASTTFATYHIPTGTWGTGRALPEAKTGGDLVACAGNLYYLGGGSTLTAPTATCYKYDPVAGWSSIASIPTAVTGHVAESWGDSVIFCVAGGWTTYLTTVQVYRPASNSWSTATSLPAGRGRRSFAGGLDQGKLFVSCGYSGVFRKDFLIGTIVSADVITWAVGPDVPMRPGATGTSRPGGHAVDGRFYMVAGETTPAPNQQDSIYLWDIAAGVWLPDIIKGRGTLAASNYWAAISSSMIGGDLKVWIPGGAIGTAFPGLWVIDACRGITGNVVSVTSPNGGEVWNVGSVHNITWNSYGNVDTVTIDYSTNNGSIWTSVASNVQTPPGIYSWTVPTTPTTQALVRVTWKDSANVTDQSDAVFTINALIPQISTSPDSLVANLPVGSDSTTRTLTIGNIGTATLTWSLTEFPGSLPFVDPITTRHNPPSPDLPKDAIDSRIGDPVTDGSGGPDSAGHVWVDSDEPGGPTFSWVDISTTGTLITGWLGSSGTPNSDDGYVLIPLPFPFTFYGTTYSASIKVCTNGWLGFDISSTNTEYINDPIPNTAEPNNIICPWWDDQDLSTSGSVHYYHDAPNNRFIVQWTNVPHYSTGGPYTYQVMLYGNGTILMQYLTMVAPLDNATIGIESQTALPGFGLQVVYNAAYMHDNLAIRITKGITWVSAAPTSGSIAPANSQDVTVTFNSTGLALGTYRGRLDISSNDPSTPLVSVPVILHIGPTGVEETMHGVPVEFELAQNYPNPFNPTTKIHYGLPEQATVSLKIYDVLGQVVATVESGTRTAGYHEVVWNGRNSSGSQIGSGIYFYRLEAKPTSGTATYSDMKKMLFIK